MKDSVTKEEIQKKHEEYAQAVERLNGHITQLEQQLVDTRRLRDANAGAALGVKAVLDLIPKEEPAKPEEKK
jgi:hypothetical protein